MYKSPQFDYRWVRLDQRTRQREQFQKLCSDINDLRLSADFLDIRHDSSKSKELNSKRCSGNNLSSHRLTCRLQKVRHRYQAHTSWLFTFVTWLLMYELQGSGRYYMKMCVNSRYPQHQRRTWSSPLDAKHEGTFWL
jgi:hypothetical protein